MSNLLNCCRACLERMHRNEEVFCDVNEEEDGAANVYGGGGGRKIHDTVEYRASDLILSSIMEMIYVDCNRQHKRKKKKTFVISSLSC